MTKVYCMYCRKDGEVSFADGQCKWIYVACPHCNKTGGLRRPEKQHGRLSESILSKFKIVMHYKSKGGKR